MQGRALQTPRIRGDRLKGTGWPWSGSTDNGAGKAAWVQMPDVGLAPGTPVCKWCSEQEPLSAEITHTQYTYLEISCSWEIAVVFQDLVSILSVILLHLDGRGAECSWFTSVVLL